MRLELHPEAAAVVELTTVGRRSGRPRRVSVFAVPVAAGLLLIRSNAGRDRHPAWFLKGRANPSVTVRRGGERRAFRAQVAAGDERAALWSELLRHFARFGDYQRHTAREIPLVLLHPER